MIRKIGLAALGLLLGATAAFASGVFVNGMTLATPPLSGYEQFGVDTQLPNGIVPQSEAVSIAQLLQGTQVTATNATSFTATAAQTSGAAQITMLLTGAPSSAQTLTLPTATLIVSNLQTVFPNLAVNYAYKIKFVNVGGTSSGVWTIAAGSGDTLTGNATVAVAGSRTYLVTVMNVGTPAVTFQDYGN